MCVYIVRGDLLDNFEVSYKKTDLDDRTTVITSANSINDVQDKEQKILAEYANSYLASKGKDQYSVFVNDETNSNTLTLDYIDKLAQGINSNLENLTAANQLILRYVNEDGLMGYAYNAIISNINTNYKLIYNGVDENGDTAKNVESVKTIIENFNSDVKLDRFIRDAISTTYLEGNCVNILRLDGSKPVIDILPMSLAYPSDYRVNGDSLIEVSIDNLKNRLQKTYRKTRKNKAVYFENIKKEIENNFPKEVSRAYVDNEKYVRLDTNYSDCITINSMGRKFGVSPFFRALRPLIVLNNLENADVADSKARSKKIIYQKLRKELLGKDGTKRGLAEQELAHAGLVSALKTNFCAYTSPAFVESVEFVTAKANNEDASTQMKLYTSKFLQSLGISFIDNEVGNYSTVNASLTQLIRTINCIIVDLERVINKYYRTVLSQNGMDEEYAPIIKISDAQEMDMAIRKEMATFVYSTLNASRETSFKLVGLDLQDEIEKRKSENEKGLDDIFSPHDTAYNKSSDSNEVGRPESREDVDTQKNDENYNKEVRK